MFKLKLSVSKGQPKTKTEGNGMVEFFPKEYDITPVLDLKELFTTRVYSTNYWKDGRCSKKNFLGMYGITFDIDKNQSIDATKELFKEFNYIIHTSTNHRADIAEKGGIQDRFRIILPFDPTTYDKFTNTDEAYGIYEYFIKKYPFIDSSCGEPARKYFPFLNSAYPNLFLLEIHDTGKYFEIASDALEDIKATVQVKVKSRSSGVRMLKDPNEKVVHKTDIITLRDGTKVELGSLQPPADGKPIPCYCLFCDDLNSTGASAFISFTRDNKHYLSCSHCKEANKEKDGKKTYFQPLFEAYSEIFYIEDRIHRILEGKDFVTIMKVPASYFHILSKPLLDELLWEASHMCNFSMDSFIMQKMVDGYGEQHRWELDRKYGVLNIYVPPVEVKIKDNAYINTWLEEMFQEYTPFIKQYLALVCYTNYLKLPFLVFTGPRGSGKSTFAELVMNMYPKMGSPWDSHKDQFTEIFENRVLIIDEALVDKKEQYIQFKKLTGADKLPVNKKFGIKYNTKNNLVLILSTNETTPMFLVDSERPSSPQDNQFFMYHMPKPKTLNSNISVELMERIGYYIRTELRDLYEAWKMDPAAQHACRYQIPVPMTELLIEQYHNSRSALDMEVDDLYLKAMKGYTVYDRKTQSVIETLGPYTIINTQEIEALVRATNKQHTNIKSIKDKMIALGYLRPRRLNKNGLNAWALNPDGMKLIEQFQEK